MLITRALAATNFSDVAGKFLDKIDTQFGSGAVFGSLLAAYFYWMAGSERRERLKLDVAREKELLTQLRNKDDRIDKLHEQIDKRLNKKNEKP